MPEDRDVGRLWLLAKIGQTFSQLPSVVAKALDEDPERLDLVCATMLGYGQTKNAYDAAKGDDAKLKNYSDDVLSSIRKNTFEIHKERRHHIREHAVEKDLDGCRLCRKEYRDGRQRR